MAAKAIYVKVRELPPVLRDALREVEYKRPDVGVVPSEAEVLGSMGGDGYRAFAVVVNLATGQYKVEWGSWGGPQAFNAPAVDWDQKRYAIPEDGAVILGEIGGGQPANATIYVHPRALAPLLPSAKEKPTEREQGILRIVRGYTSAGRKDEFERMRVVPAEIDALVAKGLLKRNRAGAVGITMAGKNVAEGQEATMRALIELVQSEQKKQQGDDGAAEFTSFVAQFYLKKYKLDPHPKNGRKFYFRTIPVGALKVEVRITQEDDAGKEWRVDRLGVPVWEAMFRGHVFQSAGSAAQALSKWNEVAEEAVTKRQRNGQAALDASYDALYDADKETWTYAKGM